MEPMALTSGPGAGVGRRGQRHGKGIAQQRPGTGNRVVHHTPHAEPGATAQTASLAKGVGREKGGVTSLQAQGPGAVRGRRDGWGVGGTGVRLRLRSDCAQ